MVRIGVLRIKNPLVNLGVAIILIAINLIFMQEQSLETRLIVFIAAILLIGRAIFEFVQKSKSSASDRFEQFKKEDEKKAQE